MIENRADIQLDAKTLLTNRGQFRNYYWGPVKVVFRFVERKHLRVDWVIVVEFVVEGTLTASLLMARKKLLVRTRPDVLVVAMAVRRVVISMATCLRCIRRMLTLK